MTMTTFKSKKDREIVFEKDINKVFKQHIFRHKGFFAWNHFHAKNPKMLKRCENVQKACGQQVGNKSNDFTLPLQLLKQVST